MKPNAGTGPQWRAGYGRWSLQCANLPGFCGVSASINSDVDPEPFDNPFMSSSTGAAAVIFGSTGGVMEAAVRTVHILTGQS